MKTSGVKLFLSVGAIFTILWILSGLVIWKLYPSIPERGQIGDMFGAINALFSGLALAGVIVAIYLQTSELRLQKNELNLQRQEMARSAEAQEKIARLNARSAVIQTYISMSAYIDNFGKTQYRSAELNEANDHLAKLEDELEQMSEAVVGTSKKK